MNHAPSDALPQGHFVSAVVRLLREHVQAKGRSWSVVWPAVCAWQAAASSDSASGSVSGLLDALLRAVMQGTNEVPLAEAVVTAWQMARCVGLPHRGMAGYGVMTAADAWSAVEFDVRVQSLRATGLIVTKSSADTLCLVADALSSSLSPVFWAFWLGCRQALLEGAGGRASDWAFVALPADVDPALRRACEVFGVTVRSSAGRYEEHFFPTILARPNPCGNPSMHRWATQCLTPTHEVPPSDVLALAFDERGSPRSESDQALLMALRALVRADLDAGVQPTLSGLVPRLRGLIGFGSPSVRQIQRRLAAHQLGFRALVADVRQARALDHLRHSNRPLADIAAEAGYAELSSFHRAVRRWTGATPMGYRQGRSAQDLQDA